MRATAAGVERLTGRVSNTLLRHALLGLVFIVVAAFALWALDGFNPFLVYQLSSVAYFAIAAAGLTLLTGLNGQLSLGHGALMAVGAYTTALALKSLPDLNPAIVFAAATVVTAAASIVVGAAAARLRGPYLAGATLGLAVALPGVAVRFSGVFGGDAGLNVPALVAPDALSSVPPEVWLAWIGLIPVAITFILLANLVRTRYGRDFRAIREDEVSSSLYGIRVARTQVLAFVVSGACAGLAGSMMAYTSNLAAPGSFPLTLSLEVLAAIVIGGLGTLPGAVWGALVIVFAPDWIGTLNDTLHLPSAVRDQLPLALFGVVFIVAMLVFPHGIQGGLVRFWRWRGKRRRATP
ncbi:MAG TPA: branched-chain amino acid ABC transporter permease [Candidatus Dormibacteraeota bacterium]|nr:branched-chain amino acid ABC transporter permease [Candidatus Dormibacteraeota bacterium]